MKCSHFIHSTGKDIEKAITVNLFPYLNLHSPTKNLKLLFLEKYTCNNMRNFLAICYCLTCLSHI